MTVMRFVSRKIAVPVALISFAALSLTACGASASSTPPSAGLTVVAGFYPLQFTAERVAGDGAQVTNLTQPGADAHGLELTPRQIAALNEADVVIHQKGFQPAVDKAIEQAKPARVLDVTTVATLHAVAPDGSHDHADEAEPSGEPEHPDEHDHPANTDPHLWLDVDNMSKIADATAALLTEAQPEREQAFHANAERLKSEYATLDDAFTAGLATCERREIIVSHAAFGYLTDRYDLTQIAIRGLNPDVEPSPGRVGEVQRLAREHGVTTVFYETLVSPAVAEAVAGDLNLRIDVLDPLEGLTSESRGADYLEIMNANLTALKEANACS